MTLNALLKSDPRKVRLIDFSAFGTAVGGVLIKSQQQSTLPVSFGVNILSNLGFTIQVVAVLTHLSEVKET